VRNGREFLFAIKEATHVIFDEDAAEFLDALCEGITGGCDRQNLRGPERDAVIFFEGMLRGCQLKLTGTKQRARKELFDAGALTPDLKVKGDA
jgi:hypothetical protein